MAISYTKKMLIQRLRQHIAKTFPNSSFPISETETLLYIDQALAVAIVGKAYEGAKIEGALVVPDAFYLTSQLPALAQDSVTGYWYTTLPQPPISLPLGYSISRMYFADSVYGVSQSINPIEAKRVSYRMNMPLPTGTRYWVEGSKVFVAASDGQSLLNQNVYATIASTRTEDVDDVMNVPDDAIEIIFNNVTAKLMQRMGMPQDIISDNLPAGNKGS